MLFVVKEEYAGHGYPFGATYIVNVASEQCIKNLSPFREMDKYTFISCCTIFPLDDAIKNENPLKVCSWST